MEGDINMPTKKTVFDYSFGDQQSSDSFLEFVRRHFPQNLAHHPVIYGGMEDTLRVLVQGTDSFSYDMYLQEKMDDKAKKLGGMRTP